MTIGTAQRARLTEGPVARILVGLTGPMALGMVGMTAFNLADTYFVGQLGTRELAAMSFTFPVILAINSLAQGLGVGITAVISRVIGEGDQQKVRRLTTDGLILSLLLVAFFVGIGLATIDPVFRFLGAEQETLPFVQRYMVIWYLGVLTVVIPMVGNSAIRATGDTRTPSAIMLVAVIVNLILDPLLIFGIGPFPRLELAGAALATVAARAITLLASLWVLYYRDRMITFATVGLAEVWRSWRQVLFIGLPNALTNMMIPLAAAIVTRLIAQSGPPAVAGFGVATRIEMFALLLVMALVSVLSPFVGQNWGAKAYDRAKTGIVYSERFSLAWGLLVAALLAVFGGPLARLFNDNPEVISTARTYFWILPISYGLSGVLRIATTTLNVLARPFRASILTLLQTFALYIPLAFLGSELIGLEGIFGAATLSYLTTGLVAFFWLRRNLTDAMEYDYLQRVVTVEGIAERPASLGYWLWRLQTHARTYLQQRLSPYQLDHRTLAFLTTLYREDGIGRIELSERLNVDDAVTTQAINNLTNLGYVKREPDPDRQRRERIFVTAKAREISEDVRVVLMSWSELLSQGFTEEEKKAALGLLRKMNHNADSLLSAAAFKTA